MTKQFINQNKLGLDECAKSQKNYGNDSILKYNLWNNYSCKVNDSRKVDEFGSDNINMHFRNGYGVTSSCLVDSDSDVRLNALWTSERAKTQLFTRPYVGNPDLSRGISNPSLESPLVQGENTIRYKQCTWKMAEEDYGRFTPLIPCLESQVQNPKHIVLPFPQSGVDSRQIMRSQQPRYNKFGLITCS